MTHVARGLDADGALLLDVVVSGHVLQLQSVADVSVKVKLLPVPPLLSCMCTPLTRRKAGNRVLKPAVLYVTSSGPGLTDDADVAFESRKFS